MMLGVIASLMLATSLLSPAQAATSTRLTVSSATVDNTFVYVSGELTTTSGQPLPWKAVTIDLGGTPQGQATTAANGSFSFSFARPAPGEYTVNVRWTGDTDHNQSSGRMRLTVPPLVTKCATSLAISLDPPETHPGELVGITGKLSCADAPIAQALVQLSTTFGNVDSIVATDEQGHFFAFMAVPDGTDFPASYTVTAAFGGDEVYIDSTNSAAGTIVALATPEPTATDTAAGTSSQPSLVTSTDPPTPSASPTSVATASITDDSSMIAVVVAFCAVALVAVGALVVLAILSHNHKRLAIDERRGFGTNFGKDYQV